MLELRNKSPVFAIARSLSLTCVYILHAIIVHILYLLDILVLILLYAWDCLFALIFNQESHSGTSTLI